MKPATVNVDCPRCDVPIVCTLERKPHGSRVPDLANRFADHYAEHGHLAAPAAIAGLTGTLLAEIDRNA